MMKQKDYKKGAASFYIVAFSALILMVIVMSFATLVVSQLERSSNEDLSQSAYDAAMAGVEDAKLAYEKYIQCKLSSSAFSNCNEIISAVESGRCDSVQKALGRPSMKDEYDNDTGVVMIKETGDGENNLQQAYTCTKIEIELNNQKKKISGYEPVVYKPVFKESDGVEKLSSIKVKWPKNMEEISVAIVQTPKDGVEFDDFVSSDGNRDRGMIFLETGGTVDSISRDAFINSNGENVTNNKTKVKCESTNCVTEISIPEPSGGSSVVRGDFELVISRPKLSGTEDEVIVEYYGGSEILTITNQFEVDSTGKANDLFRRVKVTIETNLGLNPTGVMGPLEVVNGQNLK